MSEHTARIKAERNAPALDERYKRWPLSKLTTPKSGLLHCITDHWWAVTDKDEVLFFRNLFQSPQCNLNKEIVDRLCPAGTTPRFVPVAFYPIDPSDYV
jgi:hypothetical protein